MRKLCYLAYLLLAPFLAVPAHAVPPLDLALPAPAYAFWPRPALPKVPRLVAPLLTAGIYVVQVPAPAPPPVPKPAVKRPALSRRAIEAANGKATIKWLQDHRYIRMTANNRGKEVDSWTRELGNALGSEWCGITQFKAQKTCGLSWPAGAAGSYNWFKPGPRLVYQAGGAKGSLDSLKQGHKLGLFNARKGRIAHIMALDKVVRNPDDHRRIKGVYSLAGNEGSGAKEGLHYTYYPAANIYAGANYNYK